MPGAVAGCSRVCSTSHESFLSSIFVRDWQLHLSEHEPQLILARRIAFQRRHLITVWNSLQAVTGGGSVGECDRLSQHQLTLGRATQYNYMLSYLCRGCM